MSKEDEFSLQIRHLSGLENSNEKEREITSMVNKLDLKVALNVLFTKRSYPVLSQQTWDSFQLPVPGYCIETFEELLKTLIIQKSKTAEDFQTFFEPILDWNKKYFIEMRTATNFIISIIKTFPIELLSKDLLEEKMEIIKKRLKIKNQTRHEYTYCLQMKETLKSLEKNLISI